MSVPFVQKQVNCIGFIGLKSLYNTSEFFRSGQSLRIFGFNRPTSLNMTSYKEEKPKSMFSFHQKSKRIFPYLL